MNNRLFRLLLVLAAASCLIAHGQAASTNLHRVSLRDLEQKEKLRLADSRNTVELGTLGNCADIHGFVVSPARHDVELLCTPAAPGSSTPILLEEFVTSLIHALGPSGMSLRPKNPARPDSPQLVEVYPPSFRGSLVALAEIEADYRAKQLATAYLNSRYRQIVKRCSATRSSARGISLARIEFVPQQEVLEFDKAFDGSTIIWIRQAEPMLVQQADLRLEDGSSPELLLDDVLAEFVEDLTVRLQNGELEHHFAVFQKLRMAYRLALLGKLLRHPGVKYDWSFWLSYPVLPRPTPEELPGFQTATVSHTCYGHPYEYSAYSNVRQIWGGVLVDYSHVLLDSSGPGGTVSASAGNQFRRLLNTGHALPTESTRVVTLTPRVPTIGASNQSSSLGHRSGSAFRGIRFSLPVSAVRALLPNLAPPPAQTLSGLPRFPIAPELLKSAQIASRSQFGEPLRSPVRQTVLPPASLEKLSSPLRIDLARNPVGNTRTPESSRPIRMPDWKPPPPPPRIAMPKPPPIPKPQPPPVVCTTDFRGRLVCR
jgi:hypothetical protein